MRNIIKTVLAGFTFASFACASSAQAPATETWSADNGNGTFTNPLFYDEFSDPDIIRVGSDFYLAGTTMHSVPGLVILHSKDLVNWTNVSYCFDRFDFPGRPEFSLEEGREVYGQGIWAPCIRYHDGKFYVFSNINGVGMQVYISEKITGPWKHVNMKGRIYDLSVLFDDDGKIYAVHGYDEVKCTELKPDFSGPVEGSERVIIPGGNAMGEGHHIYKIDGMYYILSADYAPMGRMQCARAKNIFGPYETCVISQRESYGYHSGWSTINATDNGKVPSDGFDFKLHAPDKRVFACNTIHQGGIVQLENGDWWGWSMQDFHSVGRTTCLSPVTWKDGWPFFGLEGNLGRSPRTWSKPVIAGTETVKPHGPYRRSDDFSSKSLQKVWQWNHNPDDKMWALNKGLLRLHTMPAEDLLRARNSLTQRVIGPVSTTTVMLDASHLKPGDIAGLGIQNIPCAWLGVVCAPEGLTLRWHDQYGNKTKDLDIKKHKKLWLRIDGDYDNDKVQFSYSVDNRSFENVGDTVLLPYQLKTFQGSRTMLFAYNSGSKKGGYADFDDFTVEEPMADRSGNIPFGKTVRLINLATGNPMLATSKGLMHDAWQGSREANSPQTRFQVIDKGTGKVILQCADGRYVYIAGEGLSGDVRLTSDKEKASVFMWQDMLRNECMLLALQTNRYVGKDAYDGAPYSADWQGADPGRRNGTVFRWEAVE